MEYRDPNDLKLHDVHSRIYLSGETLALETSIKRAGKIHHPLYITPDGRILSGVRRKLAAIKLGLQQVPVIVLDTTEDAEIEFIMDDNQHRVKLWIERANEVREKRIIIGKRQGARTDRTEEEAINTQKEIAESLGLKPNVVRILEMIEDSPEHRQLLERDMEHNTINKLENDFKKRLATTEEVLDDEFKDIDLEPHECPVCHSHPRRIFTDYINKIMGYVDDMERKYKL